MTKVVNQVPVFNDVDGRPLENGYVYIGVAGMNPETNPVQVYLDSALTQPIAQPLRTSGGMIYSSGSPAAIYVSSSTFSITVRNKNTSLILTRLTSDEINLDSLVFGTNVEKVVDTISALRNLSYATYKRASTRGYYAIGDGGGGQYYYDPSDVTSSDNGGSVIVATDGARWKLPKSSIANVLQWGAKGDGTTDDTLQIQAAIDYVCPLVGSTTKKAGTVYFPSPAVGYRITNTLNCSNSRVGGTLQRDGLRLVGSSMYGCRILGETGAKAIVDTTGSQWLDIDDLMLTIGSTNSSKVGIYQGLASALQQTQNQKYSRVLVSLGDDMTANGGAGTIALWNFGAEENTYDSCYFVGNVGAVFTTQVGSPFTAYAYPLQTQASSHSCGVNTFTGENFICSVNKKSIALVLLGVNSFKAPALYLGVEGISGALTDVALRFMSSCTGVEIGGTIEQTSTIQVTGTLMSSKLDIVFGPIQTTSAPMIKLDRGGEGIIDRCEIKLHSNDATGLSRNILSVTPSSTTEKISCYIRETTIKTNHTVGKTGLNENLVWNPLFKDVDFYGDGWTYLFGHKTQKISLQNYDIGSSGASEMVKIIMPTIVSGAAAASVIVELDGMISSQSAASNTKSVARYKGAVAMQTTNNGTRTYGTASETTDAKNSINAAANQINSAALSLADAGVAANTSVLLTPSVGGATPEPCYYNGTVKMTWSGWDSVGPTLALSGVAAP
jgi:hypothetical protein